MESILLYKSKKTILQQYYTLFTGFNVKFIHTTFEDFGRCKKKWTLLFSGQFTAYLVYANLKVPK